LVKAVSVSQLNGYVKRILATDPILSNVSVVGELTNLTRHSSGHWYFSLKDETSTLRCFLPRDRVERLRFELEEGMKITSYGAVSVYERGGSYSLNIREIDVEGEGELKKAFDLLVKKLSKEGLFDEDRKKPIPYFPKKIGVVTSPTGAAIRDIISTVRRRNPLIDIIIYPSLVQGPDAAESICEGIRFFNKEYPKLELMIVGRGGGSAEDLWCFNEESLAREIAKSKIPVISAVGHEVDYLISDYVADLRAATPTAAAEIAAPDIENYIDVINSNSPSRLFTVLSDRLEDEEMHLYHILDINDAAIDSILSNAQHKLSMLKLDIESYNPYSQLDKGYIIASKDDKWITSTKKLKLGDEIKLMFKDGKIDCVVSGKE